MRWAKNKDLREDRKTGKQASKLTKVQGRMSQESTDESAYGIEPRSSFFRLATVNTHTLTKNEADGAVFGEIAQNMKVQYVLYLAENSAVLSPLKGTGSVRPRCKNSTVTTTDQVPHTTHAKKNDKGL